MKFPPYGLVDRFNRQMDTLRISVTDRCNFRCVYCVPHGGFTPSPREDLLTYEEILRVVRAVEPMGIQVIRLTGGEPLLRHGIEDLIASLRAMPGVQKVGLTTNGSLLAEKASSLKKAGLSAVNVSLDTLNARRFEEITTVPFYERVKVGIEEALSVGLRLKINVVVLEGLRPDEVLKMVHLAIKLKCEVRFLEFMPLCGGVREEAKWLPISQVRSWVEEHFDLLPVPRGNAPAQSYDLVGTDGRVGFIASLSQPFCSTCSRLRLSATGKIRPCLFSPIEVNVLRSIRAGESDEAIRNLFKQATQLKPEGHPFRKEVAWKGPTPVDEKVLIRSIGG